MQFKKLVLGSSTIGTSSGDCCVKIRGEICLISNIFLQGDTTYVVYNVFRRKCPFFEYPLDSQKLGIVRVSMLRSDMCVSACADIEGKYVLLKNGDVYVAIPMLHEFGHPY